MNTSIEDVRDSFIKRFLILMIAESKIRVIICLSYEERIYFISLFIILVISIVAYYCYINKKLSQYQVSIFSLCFFFIVHYVYVMGSYESAPVAILWFIVIPIVTRIYYPNKILLLVSAGTAGAIILLPQISQCLELKYHHKEKILNVYELPTVAFVIHIFLLIIFLNIVLSTYYLIQVLVLNFPKVKQYFPFIFFVKEEVPVNYNSIYNIETDDVELEDENDLNIYSMREARLYGIYQRILNHMENSKCYLNSDYTLGSLANELKINKISVSNSLNHIGKISFKDLVNKYRINEAKELFVNDKFRSNNIKQIYLNVGFKYHTTFNRVFKKLEGMTPSEYIIRSKYGKSD